MTFLSKAFGRKLRQCRLDRNFTHAELAYALGIPSSVIKKWEEGEALPPEDRIDQLGIMFSIHAQDVFPELDSTIKEVGFTNRQKVPLASAQFNKEKLKRQLSSAIIDGIRRFQEGEVPRPNVVAEVEDGTTTILKRKIERMTWREKDVLLKFLKRKTWFSFITSKRRKIKNTF